MYIAFVQKCNSFSLTSCFESARNVTPADWRICYPLFICFRGWLPPLPDEETRLREAERVARLLSGVEAPSAGVQPLALYLWLSHSFTLLCDEF